MDTSDSPPILTVDFGNPYTTVVLLVAVSLQDMTRGMGRVSPVS
jgi:hypothetical protein